MGGHFACWQICVLLCAANGALITFAGGMTTDRETSFFVCFDPKDFVGSKEQVHVRNTTLPQLHCRHSVLGSSHCASAPKLWKETEHRYWCMFHRGFLCKPWNERSYIQTMTVFIRKEINFAASPFYP